MLRALRTQHGISNGAARTALEVAERESRTDRLLVREELRTGLGETFLEQYGALLNLSRSGALAIRKQLREYLARIDWEGHFPVRLYPFARGEHTAARPIAIDPAIAFGRPVVARTSIATATIAARIDAGESVDDVAADYELTPADIEGAAVWEWSA